MEKLSDVEIGKFVKVAKLSSKGFLRERMLAIGLTRGAEVEVIRRGPSGDPTVYNIRGAMIALRKDEASLVHVY
ncbi:ferrous iron transport protein A [Clostridium sp. cel8]|jgi:ferrous iron transport protein A|uniref:FeoA family protein n=1 Tax=unclassified Clostridium TaxID=2614128 RepID=UPI0015F73EE7|nr:FeoA family protein [Clostridium sp. cel8]MBA5851142.1 ferrous iron transport protein A [Clostridium sp. cel8]